MNLEIRTKNYMFYGTCPCAPCCRQGHRAIRSSPPSAAPQSGLLAAIPGAKKGKGKKKKNLWINIPLSHIGWLDMIIAQAEHTHHMKHYFGAIVQTSHGTSKQEGEMLNGICENEFSNTNMVHVGETCLGTSGQIAQMKFGAISETAQLTQMGLKAKKIWKDRYHDIIIEMKKHLTPLVTTYSPSHQMAPKIPRIAA